MINIVLFQPEKPSNVGNILRTAQATNSFVHIIGPLTFDLSEKSLKRAGMDYIHLERVKIYDCIDEFYMENKDKDIYYISRYSNQVYSNFNFKKNSDIYFMFGRESSGIPYNILRNNFKKALRIPMEENSRSLNLSNCVSIVVYEALRQNNFYDLSTKETIKGEFFLFDK